MLVVPQTVLGNMGSLPEKEFRAKQTPTNLDSAQDLKSTADEDGNVRIIVELEQEPAIENATSKGIRFKEMEPSTRRSLVESNLAAQQEVKEAIVSQTGTIEVEQQFTTVVNGFSATVNVEDIDAIQQTTGVKEVHKVNEYKRPIATPDMEYSKELVQAQQAWRDYGYKGEGTVIGIIDTGIDPSHRDMVLDEGVEPALTESDLLLAKKEGNINGSFFTEKVPYGYNYFDQNQQILDIGPAASMHGMHVAGTAAANGDEDAGGIKGIAPNAQLLALKVFSNDPEFPSTYGDIYIKAIDDAILLGADVINMSLGSTAGFVSEESPEQQALNRATENGVFMSVSAGNSAHFGNGFSNPIPSNPDIGVVGSPSVGSAAVSIASIENTFNDYKALQVEINGEAKLFPYLNAGNIKPSDLTDKTFQIAYAGLGTAEETSNVDLQGKIALIKRGSISFVEKALNAQAAGATAVVIFNNTDGYVSMANDAAISVPFVFMSQSDGEELVAALQNEAGLQGTWVDEEVKVANPFSGHMSDFTSWGTPLTLDFKPEMTAPGGNIYSTLNDDEYGIKSGTSMAAPHVAGGAALVFQRLAEKGLEGQALVDRAKQLLLNTSKPVIDQGVVNTTFDWDIPYSPRRQGAGLMQLHAALDTPVTVVSADTGEPAVALKEISDQVSFELIATNHSDQEVLYNAGANIQTDFAAYGELGYELDILEAQALSNTTITINGGQQDISVPANGEVRFTVEIDLSNATVVDPSQTGDFTTPIDPDDIFTNGYFVEGFVTLTDTADTAPELTVPYMGFHGDWDAVPIFDGTVYDETSFYGQAGAVYLLGDEYLYLGFDPADQTVKRERIAISPNADGIQEELIPVVSFLRNAEELAVRVLDKNGEELRTIRTENNIRKHYYDGGLGPAYRLDPNWAWDGTVKNVVAKDGQYIYEIAARIDEDAEWQTLQYPVYVDTVEPLIEATTVDGNVQYTVTDEGSGVALTTITYENSTEPTVLAPTETSVALPDTVQSGEVIVITATDFAGNKTTAELTVGEADGTIPYVHLLEPQALQVYNENTLQVSGYIEEEGEIETFTIGEEEIELTPDGEGRYTFETDITIEDGVQSLVVAATDTSGNTIDFRRNFFVDATAPDITINGLPSKYYVEHGTDDPVIDVTVKDNFDQIRFYIDGDERFAQGISEPYKMEGFEKTFSDIELSLVEGRNEFTVEVEDFGGNKTVKTISIYLLAEGETPPAQGDTTNPDDGEEVPLPPKEKPELGPVKPETPKDKPSLPGPGPKQPSLETEKPELPGAAA